MMYRFVLLFAVLTTLTSAHAQACGGSNSEYGVVSCGGDVSFVVPTSDQVCEQSGLSDDLFVVSASNWSCNSGRPDKGARGGAAHASFDVAQYDGACVCEQADLGYVDLMINSFENEEVYELVSRDQKTTGG